MPAIKKNRINAQDLRQVKVGREKGWEKGRTKRWFDGSLPEQVGQSATRQGNEVTT